MSEPVDFHNVASLDPEVANKLKVYLQEKESELLSKEIDESQKWDKAASQVNHLLWEYIELLDSFAIELYRHVKQFNFDQWTLEFREIVNEISEVLLEKMKSAIFTINKFERNLWKSRLKSESQQGTIQAFFKKLYYPFVSILDRSLSSYVKKSFYQLKNQKNSFNTRFKNFQSLQKKVTSSLGKFEKFKIFSSLDSNAKQEYKELHKLLRMWQLDKRTHAIPQKEIIRLLRSRINIDQITTHFQAYFDQAYEQLFEFSRGLKFPQPKAPTAEELKNCRREVRSLGATVATYRDFFLRTHPNPYVRTRFGFSEWVVGPEPAQTRKLLNLVFEIEQLDDLYERLQVSKERKVQRLLQDPIAEIEATLHEMGQPLTPRNLLHSRGEKLLSLLEELDELGSEDPKVVEIVASTLSKAISIDWKYQVLFEFPLFHQLYKIHCGIDLVPKDMEHEKRIDSFRSMISKCKKWVKSREAYRRAHDLNLLIKETETKLSEFIDTTKKKKKDPKVIQRELLEYRYQFGDFFHFLNSFEVEGKWISNQFLFVNQYLETVDNFETFE